MREVVVEAVGRISNATRFQLAAELHGLHTLEDVLGWLRVQHPERHVTDIVTQDEYTHDVVVKWDDATWLAFDTT